MISAPGVSVIIPNYNHASYLQRRIDSVLNQSYQNFEVIILDDKSTDNSREIIELYKDNEKVKHIIYNELNSGNTFKQWVKGINLSQGDYIWIAESDDYCDDLFLEDLIFHLKDNTVLAHCQSNYLDDTGTIVHKSGNRDNYQFCNGSEYLQKNMLYENIIYNASMCIWKKSCYHNISDEFLKYKYSGDWIFWTELMAQGDVMVSSKLYNYYQQHNQTVSAASYKNGEAMREELQAIWYLSKFNKISEDSLKSVVLNKINQYSVNQNFAKILKETFGQMPGIKFPSHRKKIIYLQIKRWLKNRIKQK